MPWWAWLIAGIGLLGVEMFVVDAQFFLVFLGASALVVGLLELSGIAMPAWAQWLVFAALSIFVMVTFRRRVYARIRGRTQAVPERISTGDTVAVPVRLEPGATCRVDYRGSSWNARNVDRLPIEAGSEAVINGVDDLTLNLKKIPSAA